MILFKIWLSIADNMSSAKEELLKGGKICKRQQSKEVLASLISSFNFHKQGL